MENIFTKLTTIHGNEADASLPVITIFGNHTFYIAQYEQLLYFSQEKILLQLRSGHVELIGKNLTIARFFPSEMVLKGNIVTIKFSTDEKEER